MGSICSICFGRREREFENRERIKGRQYTYIRNLSTESDIISLPPKFQIEIVS